MFYSSIGAWVLSFFPCCDFLAFVPEFRQDSHDPRSRRGEQLISWQFTRLLGRRRWGRNHCETTGKSTNVADCPNCMGQGSKVKIIPEYYNAQWWCLGRHTDMDARFLKFGYLCIDTWRSNSILLRMMNYLCYIKCRRKEGLIKNINKAVNRNILLGNSFLDAFALVTFIFTPTWKDYPR